MAMNMAYQVLEALCAWSKFEAKKPPEERTENYLKEMSLRHDDLVTAAEKHGIPLSLQNQVCRQAQQHPYEYNGETIKRALTICNLDFIDGELVHLSETPATENSGEECADGKVLSQ